MKKETIKKAVSAILDLAVVIVIMFFVVAVCVGCNTSEQLAKNLEAKSIVGDGVFAVSKISVSDPETGSVTPEIKTVIVSGKLQTLLKDANVLTYTRNESSSIFNAENKTISENLTISLPKKGNMAQTLEQLNEVFVNKKTQK